MAMLDASPTAAPPPPPPSLPAPGSFVSGTGVALAGVVPAPAALSAKLAALAAGGRQSLQLIMDFDRTISTHFYSPGVKGASCHGVVESRWTGDARAKALEYNEYYYPIEVGALPVAEKVPFMREWYERINALILASGVSRSEIADLAASAPLRLRAGATELLDWADAHGVPVTVFSAGIADVAEAVLRAKWRPGGLPPGVRVVSNRMAFASDDPAAAVAGFGPVLHMFNKTFSVLAEFDPAWAAAVAGRRHVVLVGDGLGDAAMADGLDAAVVLRAGLVNVDVDRNAHLYAPLFDVLITGDGPLDDVLAVVRSLPE